MKRKIVITTDYEIFGNGTGDVRKHVTEPAEAMCRLAEERGIPVTLFFEMEEYLAFERNAKALEQALGYDPADLMRRQAADLVRRGHDVQLHLHPQWYGACLQDSGWQLDHEKLTVDSLFDTGEEARNYIAERKGLLEEITGQPASIYRAGGFAAQPGEKLLDALAANGFVIDSSVVKGLCREKPVPIDYRPAPDRRAHWSIEKDVSEEDPAGRLWEVPIYSVPRRRYHQMTPRRLLAKFSRNVPKERQREMVDQLGLGANPLGWVSFLFQPVPIKLDYDNLSPDQLMKMIDRAPAPVESDLDVLVLIGHTKEHMHSAAFEEFLDRIASDPKLEAVRFSDVARTLQEKSPSGSIEKGIQDSPVFA